MQACLVSIFAQTCSLTTLTLTPSTALSSHDQVEISKHESSFHRKMLTTLYNMSNLKQLRMPEACWRGLVDASVADKPQVWGIPGLEVVDSDTGCVLSCAADAE